MKHSLLLLLAVAMTLGSWAAPVSQREALAKARSFFTSHGITLSSKAKAFRAPQSTAADAPYYVFNAGDNQGYAIISGDDRTLPVLGYSLSGTISEDDMPDNMRWWLSEYARQIKYIQDNDITVRKANGTSADRTHIDRMLTTEWNQTEPYNNACPKVGGSIESVTGCVATAMAQVLYYQYQQHPSTITKTITAQIPAYTCHTRWNGVNTNVAAVAAGTTIDWGNMQLTYSGAETTAQNNAVANLMLYCGAAVQMNYGPSSNGGSSASVSNVPDAFTKYFGFDKSCKHVARENQTVREWNDLVYNELANHRVVLYGGQSSAKSGHAFVINGYDANNFFYINWGWGGVGDGAYLLSVLSPEGTGTGAGTVGSGYNQDQEIIINAEPDHGGEAALQASALNFTRSGNTLSYNIQNTGSTSVYFNYGYGNIESDGTVTLLGEAFTTPGALGHTEYYPSVFATLDISTLPNGEYNIVPVAKLTSQSTYQSLWDGNVLHVTVSNGTVTYDTAGEASLSATGITAGEVRTAGRVVTLSTVLSNTGTADYEGTLYLFASTSSSKGSYVKTVSAGVIAGNTADLDISWTPLASGSFNVWLCTDASGNNVIATGTVEIAAGNGQYAITLNSMTADNTLRTYTDSDGRIVTDIAGNNIVGSYTFTTNQAITSSAQYANFISRYNDITEGYTDYTNTYYSRMSYSYYSSGLPAGSTQTKSFSFTDLPDGKYIVRPTVGTSFSASGGFHFGSTIWYDDSHVFVVGSLAGISSPSVGKAEAVDVYNLQGIKVATVTDGNLGSLPRGIYIVNGRKFVVK